MNPPLVEVRPVDQAEAHRWHHKLDLVHSQGLEHIGLWVRHLKEARYMVSNPVVSMATHAVHQGNSVKVRVPMERIG